MPEGDECVCAVTLIVHTQGRPIKFSTFNWRLQLREENLIRPRDVNFQNLFLNLLEIHHAAPADWLPADCDAMPNRQQPLSPILEA